MRLKAVVVGAVAMLSAAPTAAHAAWSFTRWGMSPEQLIAAAKGKARPMTGDAGDRVMNMDPRASGGPFTFDGRAFSANFYFDPDGRPGLRVVRLNLLDQGQCDALGAELARRYGASKNKYHGEWVDPATGDQVFFSNSYKTMVQLPCYLSYARL